MNIYIVSRGHVPRMHTAKWVGNLGVVVHVVTHYNDQAKDIRKVMPYAKMHRTHEDGVVASRNYIADVLVKRGEWYIGMDDNILELQNVHHTQYSNSRLMVTGKPPRGFKSWRDVYRQPTPHTTAGVALHLLKHWCIQHGTVYGGWASVENPWFRAKRHSFRRFVKSKLFVMRNTGRHWVHELCHDSEMSAWVVAQYGRVVVDNWHHPKHRMFEAGGLGADRRAALDPMLDATIAAYPGLVTRAHGANSALRFAVTTDAGVARWQAAHQYPRVYSSDG